MIRDCERCGLPFAAHPETETLCRVCKEAPALREPKEEKVTHIGDTVQCQRDGCPNTFVLKHNRQRYCSEHSVGGHPHGRKVGTPSMAKRKAAPKKSKPQPHGPAADVGRQPKSTVDLLQLVLDAGYDRVSVDMGDQRITVSCETIDA